MEAITLTPPTRSSALLKGLPGKWRRSSSGAEGHSRRVDSNEGPGRGYPPGTSSGAPSTRDQAASAVIQSNSDVIRTPTSRSHNGEMTSRNASQNAS